MYIKLSFDIDYLFKYVLLFSTVGMPTVFAVVLICVPTVLHVIFGFWSVPN